jgi:hypothetical protein
MLHQRQRLPLGFEAGDNVLGVHANLEHFESHTSTERLLLLRQVHGAKPSLPDFLENPVGTYGIARLEAIRVHTHLRLFPAGGEGLGRRGKDVSFSVGAEESLHLSAQGVIPAACGGEEGGTVLRRGFERLQKDVHGPVKCILGRRFVLFGNHFYSTRSPSEISKQIARRGGDTPQIVRILSVPSRQLETKS